MSHTPKQSHPWKMGRIKQPMKQHDDDRLKEYVEEWVHWWRHKYPYGDSEGCFKALYRAVEQQAEFRGVSTLELRSLYDALN